MYNVNSTNAECYFPDSAKYLRITSSR